MKLYLRTKERTEATMTALYGVAWGQCSRLMQNKCRGSKDFKAIQDARDVVKLLKLIRTVTHEFDSRMYIWDAMSQAKRRFYSYRQGEHESNVAHIKNVKTY